MRALVDGGVAAPLPGRTRDALTDAVWGIPHRMDCLLKDAVLTGARCALGCRKAGAVYPERLVKDRLPHIKRRIRTRRAPLLCGGANMQRHGWRRGHIAPAAGAAPARCSRERNLHENRGTTIIEFAGSAARGHCLLRDMRSSAGMPALCDTGYARRKGAGCAAIYSDAGAVLFRVYAGGAEKIGANFGEMAGRVLLPGKREYHEIKAGPAGHTAAKAATRRI